MEIYYVYDTMCVFCYGFSPLMQQLYEEFGDKIKFQLIPGGLWIDEKKTTVNETVKVNLTKASKKVTDITTVSFGEAFYASLIDGVVLDSMPSLKAMTAVQSENRNPFIYLEAINKATFIEGRKHNLELFTQLALKCYDDDTFEERFNSSQLTEATYVGINLGKSLGATSYPTVYLEQDNQRFEYPLDYSSYDKLKNWIMEHLVL